VTEGDGMNAMQRGRLESIRLAEGLGSVSRDVIERERAKVLSEVENDRRDREVRA
jgi:hypothetical protein